MAFIVKKLPKKLTDGLLAYWKLDNNNWLDSSNNGNTLTNNGNVTVGTGKINGDAVFNESNSLTNDSLAIPNSAFSISTWVKSSTYIDGSVIAGQWSYLNNPAQQVAINCNFGYINALWSTDGTSLTDRWVTDIPLPYDDIWHHVVLTFDGTTERIYWDGVDFGSFVPNGLSYQTSGFGIGNGNNGYFDGEIDECGVWGRALTQSEIKQLYNSGSGITYPFYSSLLLHMDGANGSTNFTDSSINDLPITVNANPQISTAQSKFGGSSAYFDGDGSYLDVSNLPSDYLSQDFTIEAWVWIDGSKYNSCLFNTFPHNSFGVSLKREDADNLTTVFIGNGSNWSSSFSSDTLLSFDTWQHIALVRRNNTITLYENGIARGSINDVPSGFGTSLRIGSITYEGGLNGEEYKGYMDEFRIIKYAAYTSNFTPPTQQFEFSGTRSLIIKKNTTFKIPRTPPLLIGLLAYWKLDTTGWIDSSGNGRNLTLVGSLSNPAGLLGNSASGFSGNDYLITPSGLAPLSGKRTYSCWVYFNSNDIGYQIIWGQGGTEDYQSTYPFIIETNNQITSWFTTENGYWTNGIDSGIIPDTDVWYHLVLTFDGSIGILYVNGTSVGSSEYSGSILAPDIDRFLLGKYYTDINYNDNEFNPLPLDGKIDEVGVWDRALSQEEITSLYNAGAGKTYPFN